MDVAIHLPCTPPPLPIAKEKGLHRLNREALDKPAIPSNTT